METGLELIKRERERQITKEGFTEAHDDEHTDYELAVAAACYASYKTGTYVVKNSSDGEIYELEDAFPWDFSFDKRDRKNYKKRLIVAGALIAAEIDRIIRQETP